MDSWDRFAAREPYFSILSSPDFLRARLTPESERDFFESGERLVAYLFDSIEHRLDPDFAPTAILEYGCGVGRLAFPLARRAGTRGGHVTAVDRSATMLDMARNGAELRNVANIRFVPLEAFARSTQTFDFICCYLVLQRMPPQAGVALIQQLVSRLNPGGIGVFLVPYASTANSIVRTTRWLRDRIPPFNWAVNLGRGHRWNTPFFPTHTYDVSRVLSALQNVAGATVNALLEPHHGLDTALLAIEAPATAGAGRRRGAPAIDVAQFIESTSIEELNQRADAYFSELASWDQHLAKPFAQVEEAPRLLGGVAALLDGLELVPGATVLEFGAGTGWLSRSLTQLGCRTILLDVSATALDMARETYKRLPVFGDRPEPRFLVFDGRRIELPDASVDRIVCFHAFHHVPNPDAVIGEFARVLAPGGIAAFAEPGPRHSRSSFSQFEMHTYQVVENDVDVHRLWRTARECGFADIRIAVFNGRPFHLSLDEFEDFLAGGPTTGRWTAATRAFMKNMRTFFLKKAGEARLDSRSAAALSAAVHASLANRAVEGEPIVIDVTVTNTGRAVWLPAAVVPGGVRAGAHIYDASGELRQFDAGMAPLGVGSRDIAPRETANWRLTLPPQPPGECFIEVDCVAADIAWMASLGSKPCRLRVDVQPRR